MYNKINNSKSNIEMWMFEQYVGELVWYIKTVT